MQDHDGRDRVRTALAELFSGYRAEWLADSVFSLFTEPAYFPQLVTPHPCFLMGGRGTGKTTALRCLSYEGLSQLEGRRPDDVREWPYYGMYYRVNTNRVKAFRGTELPDHRWVQLFAHYINLEFCDLALRFLEWFSRQAPDCPRLSIEALGKVAIALHVNGEISTYGDLVHGLELSRLQFEAAINSVGEAERMPNLSMQGAPVDLIVKEIRSLPHFSGKSFFFLVDEYENFDALQQRVVNTLIKHCGQFYSFKVGVREFGFRERGTLNEHEDLKHPADYKLIDVVEELLDDNRFGSFASQVCNVRLSKAFGDVDHVPTVEALLPELDSEEEARCLGVEEKLGKQVVAARAGLDGASLEWVKNRSPLETYVLMKLAGVEKKTFAEKATEACRDENKWRQQYGNYRHAYLFGIKKGMSGIRKYYCGWDVYCHMAAGNIRFLLELVDDALTKHVNSGAEVGGPVSFETQTKAAHSVGNKNLRDLEGLALSGARLTKLLLGLGRIFQVMASEPFGHTPEVNQFYLLEGTDNEDTQREVVRLLTEGVMHLALVRYRGTKPQELHDARQWDYAIHPVFSAFFAFSHRRKRKMNLADTELWALVEHPTKAIKDILDRQNRTAERELPDQMGLFGSYYAVSD